jgi:hypothetical protein
MNKQEMKSELVEMTARLTMIRNMARDLPATDSATKGRLMVGTIAAQIALEGSVRDLVGLAA